MSRMKWNECPVCHKLLTPADALENCPNTPYKHGKHAIVVFDLTGKDLGVVPWNFQKERQHTSPK